MIISIKKIVQLLAIGTFSIPAFATDLPITIFPLARYDQQIANWIKPSDRDYNTPLISPYDQMTRKKEFYQHYFSTDTGSTSPWDKNFVNTLLAQNLQILENNLITLYSNKDKKPQEIGYGENFRPYPSSWINSIATNMNLGQFSPPLVFSENNRGITITNLQVRALPTTDVHLYHFSIPGQGYPFDNLQVSATWVGTPIYIVGSTVDQQWSLIITPNVTGWVKTSGIAKADQNFVSSWQNAASKRLMAITKTNTTIVDSKGHYHFNAYIGSVFPGLQRNLIMIPIADADGNAQVLTAVVNERNLTPMPLAATPHNFADIITSLINRPYGWGNMYFYNDCSDELKDLYTPFGIWLPRHSSDQVTAGKMVDKSSASLDERLSYLTTKGHKLTTIVYIGGHVFMHLGNYQNTAMTYQNLWGLRPADGSSRSVIGQSVLFPLIKVYPEDPNLVSLANKAFFQVTYLDQFPDTTNQAKPISLKSMLYPECVLDTNN